MPMSTTGIKTGCNERLEFLGDAVLEVVSSEFLFHELPGHAGGRDDETPGQPGMRTDSGLLRRSHFRWATICSLERARTLTGGRKRPSVVSDAMEAVIGAIYLDGGLANAKEFIHRFILNDIEHKQLFYDSKTILQEMVQADMKEHSDL